MRDVCAYSFKTYYRYEIHFVYPPKTKQISDGMPLIPSIPKVQQMIESAWSKGFDPDGCHQLRGRLVNTQKWIGATDIVATLASLGVRYVQIMSKLSLIE